jgi:hypothetical protein
MPNKPFTIQLPDETRNKFAAVAKEAHQEDTTFAKMLIGLFSDLRPECGLKAIASIPEEFFKRGPGRPRGT